MNPQLRDAMRQAGITAPSHDSSAHDGGSKVDPAMIARISYGGLAKLREFHALALVKLSFDTENTGLPDATSDNMAYWHRSLHELFRSRSIREHREWLDLLDNEFPPDPNVAGGGASGG